MLIKSVQDAMNGQIRNELYSAYQYLAMSAYCESANLPGFAHWMRMQSREELEHAMKFYDFVLDRGGKVSLQAIDRPSDEFSSPLDVFEQSLAQERRVTSQIHDLYALAQQEKDYASIPLLQWFVTEQIEEEKNAGQVVDTLKMIGDSRDALFLLDRELGQRQEEEGE